MNYQRPIVLSIAGFDPTGGAGVLADVKTFEQHGCLGMAVLTGNTNQTESEFLAVNWFDKDAIISQLLPILENYRVAGVKIGIVENLDTLASVLALIKASFPQVPVIWDPVLAASSGFELHASWNRETLQRILELVYLVTPNINEVKKLTESEDEIAGALELARFTHVLLKGGHRSERLGVDLLFEGGIPVELPVQLETADCSPKHGSGCILSAAITANLALGNDLPAACRNAKNYIEERLASNPHLLAYHVR